MKIMIIISISVMSAAASQQILEHLLLNEWTVYKAIYNKNYTEEEDYRRLKVYKENRHKIVNNNELHKGKKVSFTMNINDMTDNLRSEINMKKGVLGYSKPTGKLFTVSNKVTISPSVDWRTSGLVSPVRDQGYCGCCYAIATAQAIEGQMRKIKGSDIQLGVQNIIDCSRKEGNLGCNGGLMTNSYKYIMRTGGLGTEDNNPYIGEEGDCVENPEDYKISISDYYRIEKGNEKALEQAVATQGPIPAGIDASRSLTFYEQGVFYDPACSSVAVNHAVVIVGYGSENPQSKKNLKLGNSTCNGADYWIIKNSWGTDWGEDGYFRLARGCNHCGISQVVSYPIVNISAQHAKSAKPFSKFSSELEDVDQILDSESDSMRTIIQQNKDHDFY